MNRTILLAMIAALIMGACVLPGIPVPGTVPTIDVGVTADTVLKTAAAQTLAAGSAATPSPAPASATSTTESPAPTASATASSTPSPDLTTTPGTATPGLVDPASTATLASINTTLIPTLTIRLYGTLPPAVPFSRITLINRSKAEAYISLQVTSSDGRYAILEYPVTGKVEVKAPVGSYLYVAWVGGRKLVGNFRLHGNQDLSITLFKDRVVIR